MAEPDLGPVVERARRGDGNAFASLVMGFDHGLRGLVHSLVGDRDVMDDVLQETYLRAFRSLHRFRGEAPFKAWLYRIAYNCAMDELRGRQRRPVPAEPVDRPAPGADPGERAAARDSVHAALMTLSPENRAAILLVDWQDLDYADAAKVLGIRQGTLASRLSRARPLLRTALEEGARAHD